MKCKILDSALVYNRVHTVRQLGVGQIPIKIEKVIREII